MTRQRVDIITAQEIERSPNYYFHHRANAKGYVSRVHGGWCEVYQGRFGEGYVITRPRFDTTNFYYIEYWIHK